MTVSASVQKTIPVPFSEDTEKLKLALAASEALNGALMDLSPFPISVCRLEDGVLMRVNGKWCEITGYKPEEAIGRTIQDLKIYADPSDSARMIQTVRQEGELITFETQIKTRDQGIIHVRTAAKPIPFEGFECLLIQTTHLDEPSMARNVLSENEHRFQHILEKMEEGYYEVDLKGNFTYFNEAGRQLHGYPAEEFKGMNHRQWTTPERAREITDIFHHMYITGEPVRCYEYEIIRKDGTIRFAEMSGYPMRDENGQVIGFCGITRDRTDKKRSEIAMRRREEKYRKILQEMDEGYYEIDLQGNLVYFNEAECKRHGRAADELLGMNYRQYLNPEQAQRIVQVFREIYNTGNSVRLADHEIFRKDGSVSISEISGYPLRNEDGDIVGFWGIARDRTEQLKAETALRRSEEKYRKILEDMEENYYETDLEGNFTNFNESTCKYHGYPAEALMGMNFRQYLSPERAELHLQLFTQLLKTGEPLMLHDLEIIHRDGSIRFADASAYLLKNENGKPIGFWGMSRDRTDQKRAELALLKSEEQYRLLVNNASDAIYITQAGIIKYHNPKTSEITGYPDEMLLDMAFAELVHPDDKVAVYDFHLRKLEQGRNPELFVFRILNRNQESRWVELSAIGIDWQGRPAALNFLRDVTHLKKTEFRLRQSQKMEAVGTLAGGIAHDFNNILYAILGFTELALDDVRPGSPLKDHLHEVVRASKRAKDLVRQILTFARQSEEKAEPIIVSPIVREALRLIRSSIPSTIDIQSDIASRSLTMGNPTQMHQIVMNLCTNAAHAMERSGGTLSVSLTDVYVDTAQMDAPLDLVPGDYLNLTVSDTGIGIGPDVLNSIFEPYFTTKPQGEGTGMGLSVVQGIVENYGGTITVRSELGHGSTFKVYLPIVDKGADPPETTAQKPPACHEHILFVDDEPAIVKMGGRMLERLGYQVTTRTSSLDALELFRSMPRKFDLVVTDMTMPQMTGDRLARELIRIRRDIPVIVCTGYSKNLNEEQAAEIGITAFIYKPLQKNELAGTIRKALEKKSQAPSAWTADRIDAQEESS